MTGGPPVRGTKLTAWVIPPVWKFLKDNNYEDPENSTVPRDQIKLIKETERVLQSIARDMRLGLLETVGIESVFSTANDRCSIVLQLPDGSDAGQIAAAVDAENIESWLDAQGKVNVAVNPWFSTKDVDQAVLSTIKVIHVLLGVHAADDAPPPTFKQKLFASLAEILETQKKANK